MNEHCIKLTGKFSIPQALDIDKSYDIRLKGGIVSISKESQEDGSYEFTYKLVPEFGEVEKDNGEIVKLKDRKHQSVKLRQQLEFIAQERNEEPQEFYETQMINIRHFLPQLLDYIETLKKLE